MHLKTTTEPKSVLKIGKPINTYALHMQLDGTQRSIAGLYGRTESKRVEVFNCFAGLFFLLNNINA